MQGITETDAADALLARVDRRTRRPLEDALRGKSLNDEQAHFLLTLPRPQLPALLASAAAVRAARKGPVVTYSPKVFLPVTNLCLDRCSYCTFRKDPGRPRRVDDAAGGGPGLLCRTAARWAASRR